MLTIKEAIKIAEKNLPEGYSLCEPYGETHDKFVFVAENSRGIVPPGDFNWTVDKFSGVYKCEHLEHEGNKPWLPIRGYRKIELPTRQ